MPVPDIAAPKVLPADIIFGLYAFGLFKDQTIQFKMLLMTITLTVIYKYVLRLTYKPTDIILPSLLYPVFIPGYIFTLPGSENSPAVIVSHVIVYAFVFASLRNAFPTGY